MKLRRNDIVTRSLRNIVNHSNDRWVKIYNSIPFFPHELNGILFFDPLMSKGFQGHGRLALEGIPVAQTK